MQLRNFWSYFCLVSCALSARAAQAQNSNTALSESLFQQGKQLSAAGNFAEACPKFAASYKLDPATGTLLNLGACEESLGKTATAWAHFNDALGAARRDQVASRVQYAEGRIKSLEARLIRLQINVPPRSDVPGLEVKLDGEVLSSVAFGMPNPIDPGHHTLDMSAPGKKSAQFLIDAVTPQATLQATVPILADDPAASAAAAPVAAPVAAPAAVAPIVAPAQAAAAAPSPAPTASSSPNPLRVVGYVVGGLGVVGLGLGTFFHVQASKENTLALDTCTGGASGNQCQSDADFGNHNSHVSSAKSDRAVSYASLGVGAAALVTGAILVIAGHPREEPAATAFLPIIERDRLGCSVSGAF
jgi:nucleoid-associated protein YgaU